MYHLRAQLELVLDPARADVEPGQDHPGGNERFLHLRARAGVADRSSGAGRLTAAPVDVRGIGASRARAIQFGIEPANQVRSTMPSSSSRYDAIIVGAGPNGLAAANTLARA